MSPNLRHLQLNTKHRAHRSSALEVRLGHHASSITRDFIRNTKPPATQTPQHLGLGPEVDFSQTVWVTVVQAQVWEPLIQRTGTLSLQEGEPPRVEVVREDVSGSELCLGNGDERWRGGSKPGWGQNGHILGILATAVPGSWRLCFDHAANF